MIRGIERFISVGIYAAFFFAGTRAGVVSVTLRILGDQMAIATKHTCCLQLPRKMKSLDDASENVLSPGALAGRVFDRGSAARRK